MKKLLFTSLCLLAIGSAQALRMPMNGKFGIQHVMSDKNKTARLDSVKAYGEWGGWVDSSAFYHYDAQNRLVAAEGYNGNNTLLSTINVTNNPDGSFILTETLLYEARNPYAIYTYRYGKDEKLNSVTYLAVESKVSHTTDVTEKTSKGITTITCHSVDGGENSVTKKDAKGRILSMTNANVELTYSYDNKGHLVSVSQGIDKKKHVISQYKYKYDANGDAIESAFIPNNSNDTVRVSFQYNPEHQVMRRVNGETHFDYTYSDNGDLMMETRIDNGNIYGAKNKVFFYNTANRPVAAKTNYNLSKYPAGSPVAQYGKLKIKDGQLCDQNDNPTQLRGISTHGIQWFSNIYTDPKAIDALVDNWKANVLRVAMYVQESGYATNAVKTDKEWNTYIDSVSNLCAKKGIYCIIDWHILTPGDPFEQENYDKAIEFWNYMSKKHANDAHVIYEICNEPNGNDVSWPRVREYGRKIIEEIRKSDKATVVLVGTPVWSQDIDVAALAQIEDPNTMYTLHFYAGSHGKPFRMRGDRALGYKAPIFISEFGTSDASGDNGFFKDATITWLNWAKKNNLSWCNWSFADKGESASMLKKGTAQSGDWDSPTEAGELIRSILRDPSMTSITKK